MYQSPVPLLVIRSSAHALIEVNGQLLGECMPDSHVAMPASDCGDYYISAYPLRPGLWRWSITRKLTLENGSALPPQAEDMTLCAWPGGVYEVSLDPTVPSVPADPFPRDMDSLSCTVGRTLRTYTLYYENGIRLLVEEDGISRCCLSLGEGDYGTLSLYSVGGRQFTAVSIHKEEGERMLLLDQELRSILELSADIILLEESCISVINRLGTAAGHEVRTRYTYSGGAFHPLPQERGFFTQSYRFPDGRLNLVTAFCEAVREDFREEAESYLAPALKNAFSFDEIKDFLGNFQCCRPPLSDKSGALLGLVAAECDRVSSARLYEFSFENGLISDIAEV